MLILKNLFSQFFYSFCCSSLSRSFSSCSLSKWCIYLFIFCSAAASQYSAVSFILSFDYCCCCFKFFPVFSLSHSPDAICICILCAMSAMENGDNNLNEWLYLLALNCNCFFSLFLFAADASVYFI